MTLLGMVKSALKKTPLYPWLRVLAVKRAARASLEAWERAGRPAPPPHAVKQQVLRDFAEQYSLKTLVETGTYYGDMVAAMKSQFETVYSIELSDELFEKARRRFKRSKNVTLIHGDSAEALDSIARRIEHPALFWLDGHYSGGETARGLFETPVLAELDQILRTNEDDVVIIDDARLFGTDPGYPTLEEVRDFIVKRRPDVDIAVELDAIRVTPRRP